MYDDVSFNYVRVLQYYQIMSDVPTNRFEMRSGHDEEHSLERRLEQGRSTYFGCDNDDLIRAYIKGAALHLRVLLYIYLCAQSVQKGVAVTFKYDHGQWHFNHHEFEACRSTKTMRGLLSRVTEFKPRKTRPCSLLAKTPMSTGASPGA